MRSFPIRFQMLTSVYTWVSSTPLLPSLRYFLYIPVSPSLCLLPAVQYKPLIIFFLFLLFFAIQVITNTVAGQAIVKMTHQNVAWAIGFGAAVSVIGMNSSLLSPPLLLSHLLSSSLLLSSLNQLINTSTACALVPILRIPKYANLREVTEETPFLQ